MDRRTQLEFLKGKFSQLSQQYLVELQGGKSLQQIKDFSYVLECLRSEIQMLEKELLSEDDNDSITQVYSGENLYR